MAVDTQNQIWAQQYGANIMQLAQQKYSKLLNTVYVKPNIAGKTFFQPQIGAWSMQVKGGRNVQTPSNDPALANRMGTLVDYHDNRLLDRGDELRIIADPRSAYTIAAASAIGIPSISRHTTTLIFLFAQGAIMTKRTQALLLD